jgi:hypothetical protein
MATKILACWLCGKSVDLNICKIDEHGLPVHERCCTARVALKEKSLESANAINQRRFVNSSANGENRS